MNAIKMDPVNSGIKICNTRVIGLAPPEVLAEYFCEMNEEGYVCELCDKHMNEGGPVYHSYNSDESLDSSRCTKLVKVDEESNPWRLAICPSCVGRIYDAESIFEIINKASRKAPAPVVYEVLLEDNFSGISIKKCLFIDRESVIEYISKKIPTTTEDGQTSRFTVNVYKVGEPDEG